MVSYMEMSHLPRESVQRLAQQFGPEWLQKQWTWTVYVDGVRWRMNIERKGEKGTDRLEIGCDGSTVYSLNILAGNNSPTSNKSSANDSIAVIEPGVMPCELHFAAQPLWVIFCAPHLLGFFPDNKMPSLDLIAGVECLESRSARFEFRYEMLSQSEFFSTFELLNDGYIREKLDDGRFFVARRDPPYENGFVKNRLQVEEVKEFGGIRVPVRVIYERLTPSGSTNSLLGIVDRWTITVESASVTNLSNMVWIPEPTGNTDIKDRRYMQKSPPEFEIAYRLNDKKWLKQTDPYLVQQYDAGVGREAARQKGDHRYYITYLLAGLSLFALVFIVWKGLKSRNEG